MKEPVYPGEFLKKYAVERVLGEGGVGRVVLARDLALDRRVAVKFLLDGAFAAKADLDRFAEEARVVGNLSHPNIVPLYSVGGEDTKTPYLVFAYVEGDDVSARIKAAGRLRVDETVTWMRQVLAGLTHAHERGVVHRDIKPNNVRINGAGEAMIMDFGMAKAKSGRAFQTRAGLVLGTPLYIAPEVLRGEPATAASDVYSVGCSLYECLSGRPPHMDRDPMKVLEMQLRVEPEALEILRPDAPRALCDVVTRALAKKLADRHRSAEELSTALARALTPQRSDPSLRKLPRSRATTGNNPRLTPRAGPVETITYASPARPLRRVLAITAVIGVLAGGGLAAWLRRGPPDLGGVRADIDARALRVAWKKSPGGLVHAELTGAVVGAAAEVVDVAADAPPRAQLQPPAPGPHRLRLTDARANVLWEKSFTVPETIVLVPEFVGAQPGRDLRVDVEAPGIKRGSLFVATADGDAQAPLAQAEADDGRVSLSATLVGPLGKLRVDLEIADGVHVARIIDEDELRLLRLSAQLERADLKPVVELVRDKQYYDHHLHWVPDNIPAELKIDTLASVLRKGLGSRAARADRLLAELDGRAFPEPLHTELAWLRDNHARLGKSVAPRVLKRLYAGLLRAVEPRDRLLTAQYRTHTPLWQEVLEPAVAFDYAIPPARPPPGAILAQEKVKLWCDREGLNRFGFETWSVTYPHLEGAFGSGWKDNPDAQLEAAKSTRSVPVEIPNAWRSGRVVLGAEVAMLPTPYAIDFELKGAPADALTLRLTQPGNPVWHLVMDGWPKKAAAAIGAAAYVDEATRLAGQGLAPATLEQALEWGSIQVTFPGEWLPPRSKNLVMTYSLPLGLPMKELSPRQRAMFTRRVWLAPAP